MVGRVGVERVWGGVKFGVGVRGGKRVVFVTGVANGRKTNEDLDTPPGSADCS